MTKSLLNCILGLAFTVRALAADAVFSPDGQSVTLSPLTGALDNLWRVNLNTKVIDKIPLDLPKDQTVKSLAGGAEGELLLLTDDAVYVHNAKGTKKLCDTSGVEDAKDLATVPPKATFGMGDWIIVTGIDKIGPEPHTSRTYFARKPGGKGFVQVFCRRIDQVGEGAFNSAGHCFFWADNALWEGRFSYTPEDDPDSWQVILEATSIAPLEYCDSNFSNTGSYHFSKTVAVAGNHVYVALGGRHGEDLLLRVKMPAEPPPCNGTNSGEALEAHYAMQAKVLSSVKVLYSDTRIDSLAATVVNGEERVFYLAHHNAEVRMMLWTSRTKESAVIGEFKEEQ